jgi:hypothetical protein
MDHSIPHAPRIGLVLGSGSARGWPMCSRSWISASAAV